MPGYNKNVWVDQVVERPRTYEMINNSDGSVTLVDSLGLVSELGTPVNADNMNHIEEGIENCELTKWSETIIYSKHDMATYLVDDEKKVFISLKDENQNHLPTDSEYWEEKSFGGSSNGGFSLFDVIQKDHELTFEESKGLAKLGSYVYKSGVAGSRYGYPNFYNRVIEEKEASTSSTVTLGENEITIYTNSNGHQFYDIADKSIVDTFYNAVGVAWFYGVDTENERVFLPRNDYLFYNGTQNAGQFIDAELPNITGTFAGIEASGATASGAFYLDWANVAGGASGSKDPIVHFDASLSSDIYKDDGTVKVKGVQTIAYMVVGNTEVETAQTEIIDVTTTENDTLPLFYSFYSDHKLNSVAYLLSQGQWNDGTIYETAYNALINYLTDGAPDGLSVVEHTSTYTDYDFVINQDNMTFRLPVKSRLASSKAIVGNETPVGYEVEGLEGVTYGGILTGAEGIHYYAVGVADDNGVFPPSSYIRKRMYISSDPTKSGIETSDVGVYLYFKVANAVENLQLLDAGKVLETLATKVDYSNTEFVAHQAMPSETYVDVAYTNETNYTSPADGYWYIRGSVSFLGIAAGTQASTADYFSAMSKGNDNEVAHCAFLPVAKGQVITPFNTGGTVNTFRFYYAQGASN